MHILSQGSSNGFSWSKKMKIQIFKCAFCPKEFNDNAAFIAHNKSKHEDNYKKDASKCPCEECFYLADNNTTLR